MEENPTQYGWGEAGPHTAGNARGFDSNDGQGFGYGSSFNSGYGNEKGHGHGHGPGAGYGIFEED